MKVCRHHSRASLVRLYTWWKARDIFASLKHLRSHVALAITPIGPINYQEILEHGAFFDIASSRVRRAPQWLNTTHFESALP
jgi:hypothetical protein